jgi:hypothetical protein
VGPTGAAGADGAPATSSLGFVPNSYTAADGDNNNLILDASSSFFSIVGPTAKFTISGIAGPGGAAHVDGRTVILTNQTEQDMTIERDHKGSLFANRITAGQQTNIKIHENGTITLMYASAAMQWVVVSYNN